MLDRADVQDEELLARAAWLYYNDGLTQSEIGDALSVSRIKVSRLLDAGRSSGLIQLRINSKYQGCLELERRLRERYGLTDCRVIPDGGSAAEVDERIGQAAAQYLMQRLTPGALLAVGWGTTVSITIRKLGYLARQLEIALISLSGGVSTYVDGLRSSGWNAALHLVPAPLIVGGPELARALREEPSVGQLLEMAVGADYKLVGIGAVSKESTVARSGQLAPVELESLRRRGAVGDVLCQFYDREGALVDHPLHERVIGVELEQLRASTNVVGAAGGEGKVTALEAALRARMLGILVTDQRTAEAVLERAER